MSTERIFCELPVNQIAAPNPRRSKIDRERLTAFQETVHDHGVQVPLVVMPAEAGSSKPYEVVDGLVRLYAAIKEGKETVPVLLLERRLSDGERLEMEIVLNTQRFDWKPMQKARMFEEYLRATGYSYRQASERIGFSITAISNALKLLRLSPEMQAEVDSGMIAESTACVLAAVEEPERKAELWQRALNKELPRDAAVCEAKCAAAEHERIAAESTNGSITRNESALIARGEQRDFTLAEERKLGRVAGTIGQGYQFTVRSADLTLDGVAEVGQILHRLARKAKRQGSGLAGLAKLLKEASLSEVQS